MAETAATTEPTYNEATPHHIRRRNRWLWFVLLSGPVVYSVYFLIGYLFAEASCAAGLFQGAILGLERISFWILVLTIVAALITAFGTIVSIGYRRRLTNGEETGQPGSGYAPFMAAVGAWLNALFTFVILMTGVPALFLSLCTWI